MKPIRPFMILGPCMMGLATSWLGCASPPKKTAAAQPLDLELSQQLSAARATYDRGAWAQAAALYKLALARAEAIDDPTSISDAAYNYALTLVQSGSYDTAAFALAEAKLEASRSGASAPDITAMGAHVARLRGKPDEASAMAESVLADPKAAVGDRLRAVLVKGEVACGKGDVAAALDASKMAKSLVATGTSPTYAAGIEELDGDIALLNHDPAGAATRFDRRTDFLRKARLYGEMVLALRRAADAYVAAGQPLQATERYYRAARSAIAQNGITPPGPLLDAAAAQAGQSGDAAWVDRVARLRKGAAIDH